MSKLTRENAILPFASMADLTGKEGSLVVWDGTDLVLASDPLEDVFGVVLVGDAAGEPSSIAVAAGGLSGTVKIRLEGAITAVGSLLMASAAGGAVLATSTNKAFAMALETGVADEHIEAILFKPVVI